MNNLFSGTEEKTFYVWVQPKDIYTNFNANMVGSFVSTNKIDNLMFLPNKNFNGYISPFQGNLLRKYQAEYDLETVRIERFKEYPSRLSATFLFEDKTKAMKYQETHSFHVGDRILKKGRTVGDYTYSVHDLSWIDFLRSPLPIENEMIHQISENYWTGISVENFKLKLLERSLSAVAESVFETLFIGRIDFEK